MQKETKKKKLNVLDIFCGGGGASMGLHQASFQNIVGIDIKPQPEYPFPFIQVDVNAIKSIQGFDLVWASPPCQAFSSANTTNRKYGRGKQINLIPFTRNLLSESNIPYCIENVPLAPIRHDLLLCGQIFDLPIWRHRIFEISFPILPKVHLPHSSFKKPELGNIITIITGRSSALHHKGQPIKKRMEVMEEREGLTTSQGRVKKYSEALEINWMCKEKTLAESIPPAYSKYIGDQLILFKQGKGQRSLLEFMLKKM